MTFSRLIAKIVGPDEAAELFRPHPETLSELEEEALFLLGNDEQRAEIRERMERRKWQRDELLRRKMKAMQMKRTTQNVS